MSNNYAPSLKALVLRLNENEDFKEFLKKLVEAREASIRIACGEADQGLDSRHSLGAVSTYDYILDLNKSIKDEALSRART